MRLENMSWDEAAEKCAGKIILVPIGSTEQHGYQLPLKTDALVAEKTCATFYDSNEVVVAPTIRYAAMRATKGKPGTVGANPPEYLEWIRSMITDFLKLRPKKILFFLGHDGGTQRGTVAKMAEEFGADKVAYIGTSGLNKQAVEKGIIELSAEGHAAGGETSLVLYFDPEHVKMDKAVDERWPEDYKKDGISKSGVDGKSTNATAETGKKLFEFYQQKLREALEK